MTKQYVNIEAKFADWMARDMGDAFTHSIVLEKNSDGTFSQGMTRIKFNAFCAGLQSLPELTGEPVAYKLEVGEFRDLIHAHELPDHEAMMRKRGGVVTALCTHAQPLQPITADDVTDEMLQTLDGYDFINYAEPKALVAATINAFIKHRGDKWPT